MPDQPPRPGAEPSGPATELARLKRAIAEMAAANVELDKERKDLAGKIQIAQHRYDVLAHAIAQRERAGTAPPRRDAPAREPAAERPTRPWPPRQAGSGQGPSREPSRPPPAAGRPGGAGPPGQRRPPGAPRVQVEPLPPETSSRFAQMLMLGLSVLLLAIAAVVFVGVISDLEPWSQVVILLAVVALALSAAPPVAHRGLTATAESVAVVGLLVVGIAGYALWTTGVAGGLPGTVYSGLVFAGTAGIGYAYHLATRLDVPRWVALLALQPVLPLIAYPLVTGPAGWALVLTAVAALDAALATATGRRPLGYLAWGLHAAAVAAAVAYAVAGLFLAGSASAALPGGLTLVLAAVVGVVGARSLRQGPVPDLAAGLLTLAVIVSAGRVLALALPGVSLLPVAVVVALVALAVTAVPRPHRRGPLWAVIVAFSAVGVVVAGLAARAGAAVVVWPPWPDGLGEHHIRLADVAGITADWQLAPTAAALTVGAAVAVPKPAKRESTVAGTALTALAAPVSLGLPAVVSAWLLALTAAGLAITGLTAATRRAAIVHVAGAGVAGLAAVGASLASPVLTATVVGALTLAFALVAWARPAQPEAEVVREWAAGAATLLLPGATAAGAVAAGGGTSSAGAPGVLAAAFVAICGSLGYAAWVQLRDREVPVPVQVGAGLATVAVAALAFSAESASLPDRLVAGLLVVTAGLVLAAPRIDAARRPYRLLDGPDLAAAAVTASVIATLARLAVLALPISGSDAGLATMAILVFAVALGVRLVPEHLRRGPVAGVAGIGALVGAVAGAAAVVVGAQVLAAPGPLWRTDLSAWWPPTRGIAELSWSPALALALLAVAAALVLPRQPASGGQRVAVGGAGMSERAGDVGGGASQALAGQTGTASAPRVSAACAVLATISAPVALGWPWWSPAALSVAVGSGYALSAVLSSRLTARPGGGRAASARANAGWVLLLYGAGAALARSWFTAAVLAVLVVVAVAVAALAMRTAVALAAPDRTDISRITPAARPMLRIGGTAVTGALLALPAGLAAVAAHLGHPGEVMVLAALAGSCLGLAVLAVLPTGRATAVPLTRYLGYGTAGVTAGATAVAFFALPTSHPAEVYAAAAVLLAVLSELLRAARRPPGYRSLVRPSVGALVAAAVPSIIALVALTPALAAALIEPYQALGAVWQGPPPALTTSELVQPSSVIAALVLTLAAALAATGFGGAVTRQAAPLIVPGLAVTLLIAPDALDAPWPTGTAAALLVFTISVLGVALTPPPPVDRSTRPLRVTRTVVLGIGLAAGGAGLAGSLADVQLTWATFGGAILVGLGAALGGRTSVARLLGWLGAVVSAQLFALTTAYLFEASLSEAAFALLAVAAVALLGAVRLRRLRHPAAGQELAAVEWLGGYGSMLAALVMSAGSPPDLAAVLIAGGAVLGLAALRPGRPHRWRRALWWTAAIGEVAGWWIIMSQFEVGLPEAYTLPFAFFALVVGFLEVRYRPELGSWVTWGPGLIAALGPSLLLVITTTAPDPGRQAYVLIGGVAVLILGSRLGHRAPLIIGSVVTALAALHLLSLAGPWLVLIPLGLLLLVLGANREKRERDLERLRGAYHRMR